MKKKTILLTILLSISLCACGSEPDVASVSNETTEIITEEVAPEEENEDVIEEEPIEIKNPEISQIRAICRLATLECYYHNVAISVKSAGSGLTHWGEKDRDFWIEYSGVVRLGVDMSRGDIEINGTDITIYIPEAEIISIKADEASFNDPICASDNWYNNNPIGSDDVTSAVGTAQQVIQDEIINDSSLLISAQDRAKKLIENYINQLGEASGVKFNITWVTVS